MTVKLNKKLPDEIMGLLPNPPQSLAELFKCFDSLAQERFKEMHVTRPYAEILSDHSRRILDGTYTRATIDSAFETLQQNIFKHNGNLEYYGKSAVTYRLVAGQLQDDNNEFAESPLVS